MAYSFRAFADAFDLKRPITSPPVSPSGLDQRHASESFSIFGPLQTLKKVSGRLSQLLLHRSEKVEKPKQRLLVVDDEQSICFSMEEYFTHHGFKVETANGVEQAVRMIKAGNYEVIIQDLRLGTTKNPDGLEIIRLAHEHNPETRIVVLTAYGSMEVEKEAKAFGADAFLRKPQPLSQVAQVVRGLIESPRRWATPQA
jgi:ActR/RegA family two-component response regulator